MNELEQAVFERHAPDAPDAPDAPVIDVTLQKYRRFSAPLVFDEARHRIEVVLAHELVDLANSKHLMFVYPVSTETDEAVALLRSGVGQAEMIRTMIDKMMKMPARLVRDDEQNSRQKFRN